MSVTLSLMTAKESEVLVSPKLTVNAAGQVAEAGIVAVRQGFIYSKVLVGIANKVV